MAGFFTTFNVLEFNVGGVLTVNSTLVDFGNISINTSALFINTATVGSAFFASGRALVGNSTSNSTINTTALTVINGSAVANYSAEVMTITDGDLTVQINSTSFSITNVGGAFFTATANNIRLGVAGNLANLTPQRLELGSGTTFISPTGLSIAGDATMNTTHLDVDATVATTVTANFAGNAARLDLFSLGNKGIVNAGGDGNNILRSDGQWVKPGAYWHSSGRGAVNQTSLDISWNGEEYSRIEVSGWLRPNVDAVGFSVTPSHDGTTFAGFSSDIHEARLQSNATGDGSSVGDGLSDIRIMGNGSISNHPQGGIYFWMEIQQHHGAYSTVQVKSSCIDTVSDEDVINFRSFALISNTNLVQGLRFFFTNSTSSLAGNVRDYKYTVKIYPT